MKIVYGDNHFTGAACDYIHDEEHDYFQDFVNDYKPEYSLSDYDPGELLEEIKQAFREEVIPAMLNDIDVVLEDTSEA